MARFLFVVPPLAGHVNPTISTGRELAGRGHEVAWAGVPGATEALLPDDSGFFPVGDGAVAETADRLRERAQGLRHAAALKFLWEQVLVPLGHAMAGDLDALVPRWQPDVVIADQQALAGAAVARKRSLRWATSATTTAELVDPLAALPRAEQWVNDQLAAFQAAVGTGPAGEAAAADGDLRFSEHLVLVFSTPELVGEQHRFPPHYAFVGPSITDRPDPEPFLWDWLDPDRPHVLVSLGTVNTEAGRRFLAMAAEALAGEPVQAILVAPPDTVEPGAPGDDLLVRQRVPQLTLLPRLDAVVSHAGHNTVCETLAHGLPLVLAPIRDDQPIIADQVVRAGAGIRVRFGRARPADIRAAVRAVLDEPSYRQGAAAIRRSFQSAGGASAAASRLEALAVAPGPVPAGAGGVRT
jgi:MGT family glycosyltransferase